MAASTCSSSSNSSLGSEEEARKRVRDLCVRQRDLCQTLLDKEKQTSGNDVQLLQKSLLSAELSLGLLRMNDVDKDKALVQLLQKHVESVLDSTYYQENRLVDEDFPNDTCIDKMKDIIVQINSSIELIQASKKISNVLDKDVIECLYWRPGALMYMYCCTVMNNKERKQATNSQLLMECCRVGVTHFQEMFKVHAPAVTIAKGEGLTTNDENVAKQLQAGIRSDSHMLALAYGGELCYWYNQLAVAGHDHSDITNNIPAVIKDFSLVMNTLSSGDNGAVSDGTGFDPISIGSEFLNKYISAAQGNIRLQSWNCDRPRQILLFYSVC